MSIITTSQFASAMDPVASKFFDAAYGQQPEDWKSIFRIKSDDRAFFEEVMYGGTGLLQQRGEGESTLYEGMGQAATARHTPMNYSGGVIVTHNMIQDGMGFSIVEAQAKRLAKSVAETRSRIAFNVLNRAFNTSYLGTLDGVELCGSHTTNNGDTIQNESSTSAALSETSIEQMYVDLRNMVDEAGLLNMVKSKKLIIPRELAFEADRLLNSTKRSGTSDNDTNAIDSLGLFPGGMVVSDFLDSSTAWFVETDADDQGLTVFEREAPTFSSEAQFDNRNVKYSVWMRMAAHWTDYRHIYGSAGA